MDVIIYGYRDRVSNEIVYVGSAINLKARHRQHLNKGKRVINGKSYSGTNGGYGSFDLDLYSNPNNYILETLETANEYSRVDREAYWIELYKPKYNQKICNKGYNGWLGKHHTEDAKRKLSEIAKGRIYSEERNHKISESHKHSIRFQEMCKDPNRRKKLSESMKGVNTWTKNKVWVTKGLEVKYINQDELGKYLSLGYSRGRGKLYNNNTWIEGRIWVNNKQENKLVKQCELSHYLSLGYTRGRIKIKAAN